MQIFSNFRYLQIFSNFRYLQIYSSKKKIIHESTLYLEWLGEMWNLGNQILSLEYRDSGNSPPFWAPHPPATKRLFFQSHFCPLWHQNILEGFSWIFCLLVLLSLSLNPTIIDKLLSVSTTDFPYFMLIKWCPYPLQFAPSTYSTLYS